MKAHVLWLLFVASVTSAQIGITELESKLKIAKSSKERSKLYIDIGSVYYYKSDFKEALKYYFQGLDTARKLNDPHLMGVAYHGIGSVYFETEKLNEAITYLKKAEEFLSVPAEALNLGRVLITIGNVYYFQTEDSLCEIYYKKALKVSLATNDSVNVINCYKNLGALFFEAGNRGDTLKGTEYIKQSLNYIRATDTVNYFLSYLGLAELYENSGNQAQAKIYLDRCGGLLPHVKAFNILDDYYYCLYQYHNATNNFEEALSAYQNYKTNYDSVINSENNKQLTELNIKYNTEQNEKQIAVLNAQKETQRLVLIIVVLLVCIFVCVAYFLFARYKKQQERKKEQELQNQKEAERIRIARDMHDEIGAGLTRIVMRSEQTKSQLAGSELKNGVSDSLVKMTSEARELSRNIGEIIWALNPKNDSLDTLFAYIRNYAHDYLEQANMNCIINFPDPIPTFPFSPELRRNVFLIVKESLNNIVKHSNATEVEITLLLSENKFSLAIKDNGKGITVKLPGSGNGLENMRKRTEESGGIFTITKNADTGTTIISEHIPFDKNPTKVV